VFCGLSAFKQSRGDRPGLARGELDAHVGVALTFRELQLDEAGAGFGVQGCVQALRITFTTNLGLSRSMRADVGTAISGP
jgi:hypothetical protein